VKLEAHFAPCCTCYNRKPHLFFPHFIPFLRNIYITTCPLHWPSCLEGRYLTNSSETKTSGKQLFSRSVPISQCHWVAHPTLINIVIRHTQACANHKPLFSYSSRMKEVWLKKVSIEGSHLEPNNIEQPISSITKILTKLIQAQFVKLQWPIYFLTLKNQIWSCNPTQTLIIILEGKWNLLT